MCLSNFIKFYNITGEFLTLERKYIYTGHSIVSMCVINTWSLILEYSRHPFDPPYSNQWAYFQKFESQNSRALRHKRGHLQHRCYCCLPWVHNNEVQLPLHQVLVVSPCYSSLIHVQEESWCVVYILTTAVHQGHFVVCIGVSSWLDGHLLQATQVPVLVTDI